MSDTTLRLDLRDLPPVDTAVEPPARLSMTFLKLYQACNRSAFLSLKHGGGAPAHNMDFGTALHLVCERILRDLIRTGERSLYAVQEGESVHTAQMAVASLTAAIVDEVLREHPELTVPVAAVVDTEGTVVQCTQDDLREAAYHFAVGSDIDPQTVLGLERKLVLDLECGWTLSGKVDVLTDLGSEELGVDDFKSHRDLPTQAFTDDSFQLKTYALLAMFGQPVESHVCPECNGHGASRPIHLPRDRDVDPCGTCHGGMKHEVRRPSLGRGVQRVRGRFLHPRMRLRDDGRLAHRETWLTRQRVADFRWDIERLGYQVTEALETGKWPAVDGGHCNQCPCPAECPIPTELRDGAGAVESPEQAVNLLAWAERTSREASAAKREVRRFVDHHGLKLIVGDRVWDITPSTSISVDKQGLAAAALEAARYGTPLAVGDFEEEKTSMRFAPRKLTGDELAALNGTATEEDTDGDAESRRDHAYGAEAPF